MGPLLRFDAELQRSHEEECKLETEMEGENDFERFSKVIFCYKMLEPNAFHNISWHKMRGANADSLLHVAVACGNMPAIRFMLPRPNRVFANLKDAMGRTPLHRLGEHSYNIIEVTDLLISSGARLDETTSELNNVAHELPKNSFVFKELYESWVNYIIEQGHGKIFKQLNSVEKNPLHVFIENFEASQGMIEVILGNSFIDIDACDTDGNSILLLAVLNHRRQKTLEIIERLGGNMNIRDKNDNSVLHLAVDVGNVYALTYFLSRGLDIDARNSDNESPAGRLGNTLMNHVEITRVLIENGANIHDKSKTENLCHVISSNTHISGQDYHTWVTMMTRFGHKQLFSIKDNAGNTPLHVAVEIIEVHNETLELLYGKFRIDPNAQNLKGLTVMQNIALFKKNVELLKTCVKHGSDWKICDNEGANILQHCLRGDNYDAYKYIESLGS